MRENPGADSGSASLRHRLRFFLPRQRNDFRCLHFVLERGPISTMLRFEYSLDLDVVTLEPHNHAVISPKWLRRHRAAGIEGIILATDTDTKCPTLPASAATCKAASMTASRSSLKMSRSPPGDQVPCSSQ